MQCSLSYSQNRVCQMVSAQGTGACSAVVQQVGACSSHEHLSLSTGINSGLSKLIQVHIVVACINII